jgi:2-oxoisovalerate dehydrogenase E1 component
MHIADLDLGILGANGIVGAAMPLCTGAALAAKLSGLGQVAVAFFGDGASNQGVFHESMNLAAIWKLPMLFVCENNHYALTTSYLSTTAGSSIADRALAYDVPGIQVNGNDASDVYFAVKEAVERARAGHGPTLIEALTYRWGQHSMRANLRDPRPKVEYDAWIGKDPLKAVERELIERQVLGEGELAPLQEAVRERSRPPSILARRVGSRHPKPHLPRSTRRTR